MTVTVVFTSEVCNPEVNSDLEYSCTAPVVKNTSFEMKSCKASHFAVFVAGCVILILLGMRKTDVEFHSFKMKWWPKLPAESYVSREERPKTVVLFYTQFPGAQNRDCCPSVETKEKCSLHHFDFTFDKQRFEESDIVVFHGRTMARLDHLKSLLKIRPTSQRWVWATWESPKLTSDTTRLNGLFNIPWTYRKDSDIWSPYGTYQQLSEEEIKLNKMSAMRDYTQGKSELVAWIVSNCRSKLRLSFVWELKKYTRVDVFGRCSSIFGQPRTCPKSNTTDCLKKYKFYLAFENALCEDYITEKYWKHLGKICCPHFLLFMISFVN